MYVIFYKQKFQNNCRHIVIPCHNKFDFIDCWDSQAHELNTKRKITLVKDSVE